VKRLLAGVRDSFRLLCGNVLGATNVMFCMLSCVQRLTEFVATTAGIKVVFVATDRNPLIKELEEHMKDQKVSTQKTIPLIFVGNYSLNTF
jgi:cobalamin biosynthesis Co2+ chelatase CbiK